MSQETMEELKKDQKLLREEVNQLQTQMNLVIQILLEREGNPSLCQPHARPTSQTSQPWVIPPLQQQHQQHRQPYQWNRGIHHKEEPKPPPRRFDLLPMPHNELLQQLLKASLVKLKKLDPPTGAIPPKYNANARCEYHANSPGHTLEKCWAFRHKVQDLIDNKQLTFE